MRLKITLAYIGTDYNGWQRQPGRLTVQGLVEQAASRIASEEISVVGAGRTDAGVHAAGQVCHLNVTGPALDAWVPALNALLPTSIRAIEAIETTPDFHARYDVSLKTYRYHLDLHGVASPFLAPFAWHPGGELDIAAMSTAGSLLVGPTDQRAFATRPEAAARSRPIEACRVQRGRLVTITVVGRSFLRQAVRGIVGTLVAVGRGLRDPEEIPEIAASGERSRAGATAPAHGLLLQHVEYPQTCLY